MKFSLKLLFAGLVFAVLLIMPAMAEVNITTLADGSTKFSNGTYWIIWEPIGPHVVGDSFFVNGTTNLSAGTKLYYTYMAENWDTCHTKICKGPYYYTLDGLAAVESRVAASPNTISLLINTTDFKSDNYSLIFGMYSSNTSAEYDAFAGPGGFGSVNNLNLLSALATPNTTGFPVVTPPASTAPPTSKRAPVPISVTFGAILGSAVMVRIMKQNGE
ncbi:MAG: hypothetical protein LUQ50_02410 [Methanospirillum sp.]|uniref:hypothetical protein n=1 Tax=Methanospirillum sp. TaxID=45200 RepID=UPI00236FE6EA|nr:hypothetical protein [Methanospirillum sp.]MDD1727907.1 hypothetical protein [Methanospirillum sp.]